MAVWDVLPIGIIVLGKLAQIVASNKYAEQLLAGEDGLSSRSNTLRANSSAEDSLLRELVNEAIRAHHVSDRIPTLRGLRITRRSGRHALEVGILRLHSVQIAPVHAAAVVAIISDPDKPLRLISAILTDLYGLTRAEAQLAAALANTESLQEIADRSGTSLNTVRWTLKQVQSKTGARRQATLMRLLVGGPANLDLGESY